MLSTRNLKKNPFEFMCSVKPRVRIGNKVKRKEFSPRLTLDLKKARKVLKRFKVEMPEVPPEVGEDKATRWKILKTFELAIQASLGYVFGANSPEDYRPGFSPSEVVSAAIGMSAEELLQSAAKKAAPETAEPAQTAGGVGPAGFALGQMLSAATSGDGREEHEQTSGENNTSQGEKDDVYEVARNLIWLRWMNKERIHIFSETLQRLIQGSTPRTFEFKETITVEEEGVSKEVKIDEKIEIGIAEAIMILKKERYKLAFRYGGTTAKKIVSKVPPCNFLWGTLKRNPVFAIPTGYFDESEASSEYENLYTGVGHELLESALIVQVTLWFDEAGIGKDPRDNPRRDYWYRNGLPADNPVHMWVKDNWG